MDISGRIRAVLERMDFAGSEERVYALMVRALVRPEPAPPHGVCDGFDDVKDERRWVYETFRETGALRAFGRFEGEGWDCRGYAKKRFEHWRSHAARLVDVGLRPVHALWYHWILLLGERELGAGADRELLSRLWFRGFYEQQEDGRLLRWDPAEAIDGLVYDELTAIHAAYNSAKVMGDSGMMERVGRAVRWHVENTQPDNATNEPWGLAAFAALDETGTFAEQQLHDAVTRLGNGPALPEGKVPVAVGLLADAVMTMEGW